MDDAQLRTVWQQRQFSIGAMPLSIPLSLLMKRKLGKKVRQLSQLAQIWDDVIPQSIRDHTALESFNAGVLTVLVDSSPHRFQLQTLLAGGLFKQIQESLTVALNRIKVVPGQFSAVDIAGAQRYDL